ncbi:MAG: rod shape-determining protein MreC [Ilumatobacteraceae bacterium]
MASLGRRRVVLLVVLTSMMLITLDQRGSGIIDSARSAVSTALRPFETVARVVALPFERIWNAVFDYDDVRRENEALRDQLDRMRGADIEARSAILEYQELLRINQLTSSFIYDTLTAQVVGASPSNFQNTVEINIGSASGIEVGMPVIDGAGLIGRITKVFPDRSLVLLITDPDFAVSAQVLSTPDAGDDSGTSTTTTEVTTPSGIPVDELGTTPSSTPPGGDTGPLFTTTTSPTTTTTILEVIRETGTLSGSGAGSPLLLSFVDMTSSSSSVRIGAVVDTAGGNLSTAPQGIPIGFISRIVEQSGTSSVLVEVRPSASLQRLNFVAVVLYLPNEDAVGR